MSDLIKAIKAIIFPKRCIFCNSLMFDNNTGTCEKCQDTLPFIEGDICYKCACEKKNCSCANRINYYDKAAASFYYKENVRACIHKIKFSFRSDYAKYLAEYMLDTLKSRYKNERFDFIACVPLHEKDLKQRGFNQSAVMAKYISEKTGIPFKENLIIKIYNTEKQSSKTAINRGGNVAGAFDVCENIDGCSVLLVDDIITTGTTLSECGKMLYLNGAENICCLTVATSVKKKG